MEANGLPSGDCGIFEGVEVLVRAMGPMVAVEVFDGIGDIDFGGGLGGGTRVQGRECVWPGEGEAEWMPVRSTLAASSALTGRDTGALRRLMDR